MWKHTSEGVNNPVQRKFIVDINSQLPVLLCIADASDPNLLTSTYFYADAQVVCQRRMVDPGIPDVYEAGYYVHDRLGSVRLVVRAIEEPGGWVVRAANSYTYTPYGQFYEGQRVENIANPFKFTGQWHDTEIDQYHLRARQYDPTMMRFTSRDPVIGECQEPLTLHNYLYCTNEPLNHTDLSGESALTIAKGLIAGAEVYAAGSTIAAIGAEIGNFDLIIAGGYIQQLAPLAVAWGMATSVPGGQNLVSRWGSKSEGAGWVMKGRASYINYALSGKWQPGMTNQFAWPSSGHSWPVDPSNLKWPSGFLGFLKGLLGQRIYTP